MIDKSLSFNNHAKFVVNRVLRKLGVLRRVGVSIPMAAAKNKKPIKDNDFTHF